MWNLLAPPDRPRPFHKNPIAYLRLYLWSLGAGFFHRREWEKVRTVALFVGYPRTGASMMGALLDAHPNMVFAQELHLLRASELGFSRNQIYALILRKAQRFHETGAKGKGHVAGSKYSYAVPDQWQGRHEELLVLGDKQAPGTTARLTAHPELAARLAREFGDRLRIIHMIRNPFDSINGIFRLKNGRGGRNRHIELRQSIDYYFRLVDGVIALQRRHRDEMFDLRLEELILDPVAALQRTCAFLEVPCPEDYVRACASILFPEPKSRTDVPWTLEEIALVKEKIAAVPFLQGYTVPPSVEASARGVAA
jgi:hypothetical protein